MGRACPRTGQRWNGSWLTDADDGHPGAGPCRPPERRSDRLPARGRLVRGDDDVVEHSLVSPKSTECSIGGRT
jgi:hypothetical protein